LQFQDVLALGQLLHYRIGVLADEQQIAEMLRAERHAAHPRDMIQKVEDQLTRLCLQAVERRRIELADGQDLHAE
jgi:hypothetical protein